MPPVKFHAGEDVLGSATEPGMMAIVSSERKSSCQVLASSAWAVYLTWLLVVVFALPPFCAIVDVAVGCLVVNVVLAIRFLDKYKFVGFASMGSMRQVLLRLLDKSGRRV